MQKKHYSKAFRVQVAKEAALPENDGLEHIIAEKYSVRPTTVAKWKQIYLEKGTIGLSHGMLRDERKTAYELELEKRNRELEEEVEILKKAAAFLANVKRD